MDGTGSAAGRRLSALSAQLALGLGLPPAAAATAAPAAAASADSGLEAVVAKVNGLPSTIVRRRRAPALVASASAALLVEPLPAALGAEVSGIEIETVDWESSGGRALGERLREEMHCYGLLVFRGQQTLSPEQNLRLCHALSAGLTLYPRERGDKADGSHDDVIDEAGQHDVMQMSGLAYYHAGPEPSEDVDPFFSPFEGDNMREDGTPHGARPSRDSEGFEWHDDAAGHVDPRPLSMLYCVESPEVGGETLFLNGTKALEQLGPETRAVAERLLVHYCQGEYEGQRIAADDDNDNSAEGGGAADSPWDRRVRQYGSLASAELTENLAEVTHSHMLVQEHPVTGARVLSTAASFVHHVEDTATGEHWSAADSWRFISDCFTASLDQPELIYAHQYVRSTACEERLSSPVSGCCWHRA